MSIHWIRNVLINLEKTTIRIQFGDKCISDKCYTKIGNQTEKWFEPKEPTRDAILEQGIELLKKELENKEITTSNGNKFNWK